MNYIASTSRDLDALKRAWLSVVYQEGKSVLDSELNLTQAMANLRSHKPLPSGMVSDYPVDTEEGSFVYYDTSDPSFVPNTLTVKSFLARVAGHEVLVSGTQSTDATLNNITLPAPSTGGQSPDIKRVDFVFLEVWKALVTPSSSATGFVRVLASAGLTAGDTINFDGTALGGNLITLEAGVDFDIVDGFGAPLTESHVARNISDAVNLIQAVDLGVGVSAETRGTPFVYLTFDGGANGNQVSLTTTLTNGTAMSSQSPVGGTDGTGIPQADKIYFAGNTECDPSLYFDEDLRDNQIGVETTKRVQLQYRIRVYSEDYDGNALLDGVNPKTQPFGFENENVVAQGGQGAPVAGYYFSRADGVDVVRGNGTNSYSHVDTGLFYVGDGSEHAATDLGSVDGYVYAIPLCFVARRNEGRFHPSLHVNDGLLSTHAGTTNAFLTSGATFIIPAGVSDRPDGLFSDQVSEVDVLDLRRRIFRGIDYTAELERQFQTLLDNSFRTWMMDGSDYLSIGGGSGDLSSTPLICDEIGRSVALGGPGGTTGRGNFIRNFDAVCSRFSDAPVMARKVVELRSSYLGQSSDYDGLVTVTRPSNPAGLPWYEGDTIVINLTTFDISQGGGVIYSNAIPQGTKIIDVFARHNDGHSITPVSQKVQFLSVEGLGTDIVTLVLDRNQSSVNGGIGNISPDHPLVGDALVGDVGSSGSIYLTIVLEYPAQVGLSATPSSLSLTPTFVENANAQIRAYFKSPSLIFNNSATYHLGGEHFCDFREGVREVCIESIQYHSGTYISDDGTQVTIPHKIHVDADYPLDLEDGALFPNPISINYQASTFGESESVIVFTNAFAGQAFVRLRNCYIREPFYGTGEQCAVYYRAVAPQTCGTKADPILTLVPPTLTIKPIAISNRVWSIQSGSGSPDESFPYAAPGVQIGVHTSVAEFVDESSMMGSSLISLDDFTINSGLASLPPFLPMDGTGNMILQNPVLDAENRVVYEDTSDALYRPSAYAKGLREAVAHKNAIPMLARIEEGSSLYRRGEIVLVVFARYSEAVNSADGVEPSKANMVQFSPSEDRTVACVFRTQNLLLSGD